MALSLARKSAKLAVVGGTLYYTTAQGVWGTTYEGKQALGKISTAIGTSANGEPGLRWKVPVPEGATDYTENWNTGVKTVLQAAGQLPTTAVEMTASVTAQAKEALANLNKGGD